MSLIAIEPVTTKTPISSSDAIKNDGWFPDLSLTMLRDVMRLDGTVTEARLVNAAINAMLSVNQQLADWKLQQQQQGYLSLHEVPASQIHQESRLLHQYRRAVFSTIKADLVEKYFNYDSTASSINDKTTVEWITNAPAEERRNAQWAIADMVGRLHMTVELI